MAPAPGAGGRERRRCINARRSGKDRAGVGGEGGGIVLLAGTNGGGAVGLEVAGGEWVLVLPRIPLRSIQAAQNRWGQIFHSITQADHRPRTTN